MIVAMAVRRKRGWSVYYVMSVYPLVGESISSAASVSSRLCFAMW